MTPITLTAAEIQAPQSGPVELWRPLEPQNCAVDGGRLKEQRAEFWEALDFQRAIPRTRSRLLEAVEGYEAPYDLHLEVPRIENGEAWTIHRVRPIWEPGDTLWVREEWRHSHGGVEYAADNEYIKSVFQDWLPANELPRWASRSTVTLTSVRVERRDVWGWVLECERNEG